MLASELLLQPSGDPLVPAWLQALRPAELATQNAPEGVCMA
jgi:hypothetical protein